MFARIAIVVAIALGFIAFPSLPVSQVIEQESEAMEWDMFHADAVSEYSDQFTALFNSYETKWSKNGRLMIRQGDSGSYRFAKKA